MSKDKLKAEYETLVVHEAVARARACHGPHTANPNFRLYLSVLEHWLDRFQLEHASNMMY